MPAPPATGAYGREGPSASGNGSRPFLIGAGAPPGPTVLSHPRGKQRAITREYIADTNDASAANAFFAAKMAFTIGPAGLERALAGDEVQIIDVRAEVDHREGHVPGALSLPRDRWDDTSGLSLDRPNVLVCYSPVCHLAAEAAVLFSGQGYPVMELDGGMREWREHGGEEDRTSNPSHRVAAPPPS